MPSGRQRKLIAWCCLGLLVAFMAFVVHAQSIVGPDQMNYCDQATFTTTITNDSATQSACLLEIVRSYTETGVDYVPGSTTITLHNATVLTDEPTANAWDIDGLLGEAYTLPPTESIIVSYDLLTSCAAVSGTEQVTVNYEDCEDPGVPLQNTSSASIEILPGAIAISKTPSLQDARVGDLVAWTITVENTGLGRVDNVVITDVLGPGLAYDSSTGGGSNVGQTTTWNVGSLDVGATASVTLTAELVSCSGLYNDADVAFGCSPSDACFDTAVSGGTATASLNLIVDNPALSFTPPNVTVDYCTDETAGLIQITNSGASWARNIELCCDIAHLQVDTNRLPDGTTYGGGCFQIPDIPPSTTFDLAFYVLHAEVDWCNGPLPSGDNVFQLTYANDCDIPFVAFPQFSSLSTAPGPSLNVTKTGPASLRLGEIGSYSITVEYVGSADCGGGSPGPVTIVDTYPEGFTVIDSAGGIVDAETRSITWEYDPNIHPPFSETVQLEAPADCGYCAQPGGGSDANAVTATGTDCCGCTITSTASADTTILCEGYGGVDYFSSTMALDRDITVRCSMDYAVTVTHTYTFIDDPALDEFLLNEFLYFADGNSNLAYVPGSASVTGGTLGTVVDNTPAGRLELPLTDATSVRGQTLVYEYTMIVQDLDSPSCQPSTIPFYAGVDLLGGVPELGLCGTMYPDPPAPSVVAQPPAMNVTITGIPEIQEFCATYPITITLTRTSSDAKPYDVRMVLTNHGGSILDFSAADCSAGSYSPTDGTTCTAPIVDGNTYEWRYADLFDNQNDTAVIVFDVTVPCSGPLADLSVVATFDDLCHNDAIYGDACSAAAADGALLSISANVFTRKSPEILYATTRDVEWSIVVQNTGNAAAHNVWVDDTLGSGLAFDDLSTDPAGATVTADQDHLGSPINGATFLFDSIDPGESITITFAADLVACDGLTNDIAVAWGCGGSDCQAPRTDGSVVVIPPAKLVATSYSPTPVPMCSEDTATVTVKNSGVATVYNIIDTVALPTGLQYLGNPEVQVNGGGWTATGEPAVDGQTLTWTSTETPELASADPTDVVMIRFTYTVFCDFAGGNLSFQATYEDPCGDTSPTNIGVFALGLTSADVEVTLRQVVPAPGEPLDCGGEATWEIDVENTGSLALPVVQVEAFLDAGLAFVSSSGDPTYGPADGGTNAGQSVFWELVDLPVDAVATFQLTATAASGGLDCEALDIDVDAAWGCGDVDGLSATFDASCTTTAPASGTISATREPTLDLAASLSPRAIEACSSTTELTLEIANTSTVATTSNVDAVITLPSELTYVGGSSEIDCGSGYAAASDPSSAGQTLTWYDVTADGGANDACESIPPGGTIRLRFDVDVSCYFTTQNIPITVYAYDCCGLTQYDSSTSVQLTSLLPSLTVDKSPVNTNLDCYDAGDTVTWTITITNNGTGGADWVRLVDTLGSSLVVDSFTDLLDETPSGVAVGSQVGQTITWEANISLTPGESLSTTVTAHAIQPSDDCGRTIRRNTAVATWGCGALAAPDCEYGTAVQDVSTVRVPNLDIEPADINPVFSCEGDGITPGSGQLLVTVRNQGTGDAPITEDFAITIGEPNAGFSVSDTFVGLGGTLPLNDETSQTLTLEGWDVSCSDCAYAVTVTLDADDTICECAENDNAATLAGAITLPDVVIDSADLSVTCAADGQFRIQGPITLRNDGCGDPMTQDLRLRFRVFDGASCTGTEIDTFTVTWAGVALASGGGSMTRDVDQLRTLDVCSLTEVSVLIEVDDDDQVCECSGDNNTLCAGPFALALPDVAITDTAVNVPNACDAGSIDVTIQNFGTGVSPAGLVVRITGDAAGEGVAPSLIPGASVVAAVPLDAALGCGPVALTVTVDPDDVVCECSDGTNTSDVEFAISEPDLVVSNLVITCQPDGTIHVTATVSNIGDDASGNVAVRVSIDGSPINTETISLAPGEVHGVDLATNPVSCGIEHTIRVDADAEDEVCECSEANNDQEAVATCPCPALSVDKVVANIVRGGASIGSTGPIEPGDIIAYRYTIANVGGGTAFAVDFTDTLPIGLVTETDAPGSPGSYAVTNPAASGSLGLADGAGTFTTAIGATITGGGTLTAEYTVIATSDIEQGTDLINIAAATGEAADGTAIPGENATLGDTSDDDEEDPDADDTGITILGVAQPALSVDKTIVDIVRPGEGSIGISGPVEPGDIVSYRFVIRNVGGATAYDVEFTDTLPPGMVTVGGGTYSVSAPSAGGSLELAADALTFTTSINAEIDGGGILTADFEARVTSDIEQGVDLVNIAEASGVDGFGTEIPNENASAGDTSDDDIEDPDADDTGIAIIGTEEPGLSVDKIVTDIVRNGSSIGTSGPVEPGDVIFYRYTIRNVGLGTAYDIEFTDTLPAGLVTETDAPGNPGSWAVDDPPASGSLGIADAVSAFTTSIDATIVGGGRLVADYAMTVTSDASQGVDLVNVATAIGIDGAGNPIPGENVDTGDTSDDDAEDPDADDTGIAALAPHKPALSVDKQIVDVIRDGSSVGLVDPILYGDVLVYRVTIRNVGLGTAYDVEFSDTLPAGLVTETGAPGNAGGYVVDAPVDAGALDIPDDVGTFSTSIDAVLAGGATLTAGYTVLVTPEAPPSEDLINVAVAAGIDGAGNPIPGENIDADDTSDDDVEDPDADDTGVAILRVGLPALVTEKVVLNVTRDGQSLGPMESIRTGDIVTYQLRITNVGDSVAFDVEIRDLLPLPFVYVAGSTVASWPARIGDYNVDPSGSPGPTLVWSVDAVLAPDEVVQLRFDARIGGDIQAGETYTNVLQATGRDGADRPIPPNNVAAVPDDVDPDDRDDVSLVGGSNVPALVTTKQVEVVLRNARPVADLRIEVGDMVRYELTVRNVGQASAHAVDVSDRLPNGFEYVAGSANAIWPAGSDFSDPNATGANLHWPLDAALQSGDLLILRFDALVVGPIFDGLAYWNNMQATGEDAAGLPIPVDQSSVVPDDIDPDDASGVSLIGRSAILQGEGGQLIPVPILRKEADIVREAVCEAWTAEIDRLWFQTDIALYASFEFERLTGTSTSSDLVPETLLPTWLRTVTAEGEDYALDNLLQVDALSTLGVKTEFAPLTLERASSLGLTPREALLDRWDDLAAKAGVAQADLPEAMSWIFLEYAGGEPVYERSRDTALGPAGDWSIVDTRVSTSALGMGLLKQATEASALLAGDQSLDRYVGMVLAEIMIDKILALDAWLSIESADASRYVPHAFRFDEDTATYHVEDESSQLFDQLALLWGLAEFKGFAVEDPAGWEDGLRERAIETTDRLLSETLAHIESHHVAATGDLIETAPEGSPASTVNLGLLIASLDAARSVGTSVDVRIERLLERAVEQLADRQTSDGRFGAGKEDPAPDTWALTPQLAGILGLLIAHDEIDDLGGRAAAAERAFAALEAGLWDDTTDCSGLYASYRISDQWARCYTPLDVGLAIGALRELAEHTEDPDRSAFILTRMSRFVRSLVDEAAMQLSNASSADTQIHWGTEAAGIVGLKHDSSDGELAPVFQQRLCIETPGTDDACSGWRRSTEEPWYQTDVSMYASYVIQDRAPDIEDVADANLTCVLFHSGLGVPLADLAVVSAGTTDGLIPVALPYSGGSPELVADGSLAWQSATFDTRVTASALGMTLLREAQEIGQLLEEEPDNVDADRAGRLLTASLLAILDALREIRAEGPEGVLYVPHAVRWSSADPSASWSVVEEQSTLFDQLALLWGLTEAARLLDDPRVAHWTDEAARQASDVSDLIESVLDSMERAHFDSDAGALVDRVTPSETTWIRDRQVSTSTLGLVTSALEAVHRAFGTRSSIGARAVSILALEVDFLDEILWRGVGSYSDEWIPEEPSGSICEAQTLSGQVGALRALLAANEVFGGRREDAVELFQAIDARFWDADLRVYRTTVQLGAWCVTPLDLGMTIDGFDRVADLLDDAQAAAVRRRLGEHVDRIVDGASLQLPRTRGVEAGASSDSVSGVVCTRYAPVFDQRVCLQPGDVEDGVGWANVGDLIRYRVTVENPTDETFRSLVLTDILPAGVELISTEPSGSVSGQRVEWTFEPLLPDDSRTWTLLVSVSRGVPRDMLENCATLTYVDPSGAPGPTREACVETKVDSLEATLGSQLANVSATYRTDEAMYLASALEDLAQREAVEWFGAEDASAISLENLGVLLTGSQLGVPLRFSPRIPDDNFREESLSARLAEFAAIAGLPGTPIHEEPIYLPFDRGTPILDGTAGFIEVSDTITPSALGWILVREVQFLDAGLSRGDGLASYLHQLAGYIVDSQLEWILGMLGQDTDSEYMPRTVRAVVVADDVLFSVSDPTTTLYGQASLLIGLLDAATSDALSERSRSLAEQAAAMTFERLSSHWQSEGLIPLETLPSDGSGEVAGWPDLAVAAHALRAAVNGLAHASARATLLLDQLGDVARQTEPLDAFGDEAARLLVLAISDSTPGSAGAASPEWVLRTTEIIDDQTGRWIFGPRTLLGWPETPRQLGILFELLSELATADASQRSIALGAADILLSQYVLADRVQLVAPGGTWLYHTEICCFGLAPVFATHRGELDGVAILLGR